MDLAGWLLSAAIPLILFVAWLCKRQADRADNGHELVAHYLAQETRDSSQVSSGRITQKLN